MAGQDRAPSFDEMILERFVRKRPIAAGPRFVLERLFDASEINDLFERHRVRQYSGKILFAAVVQVMLAVVSRKVDSAHAAMQAHGDALGASVTAFYNKINGTEPQVATALVAHSFVRGRPLVDAMGGLRASPLLGWRLRILDGNHLAAIERRLSALWGVAAGPLPGPRPGRLRRRGHDGERRHPLRGRPRLRALGHRRDPRPGRRRRLLDRRPELLHLRDHVRRDGSERRLRDPSAREHRGARRRGRAARARSETGEVFEQAWKLSRGDTVRVVRRATVVLDASTRDGDREVHVLTSLPSEVNAAQVATLYLSRWTIESTFADLARWLDAEIAPLGYPRAARLGFCVGLMAYNAVSTLLGAPRVTHGEDVVREQVSRYYLAQFGRDAVGAVDELVEEDAWGRWRGLTLLAAAALLKETAARIDPRMVRKHARGPKKPVPKRTRYKNEPHVATARLLNGAAKEDQPKKVKKAR